MPFKKKIKEPYLSKADRERIAKIESGESTKWRTYKAVATLALPGLSLEVCFTLYGETKDEVKKNLEDHLKTFKENDPKWECKSLKWVKDDDVLSENE